MNSKLYVPVIKPKKVEKSPSPLRMKNYNEDNLFNKFDLNAINNDNINIYTINTSNQKVVKNNVKNKLLIIDALRKRRVQCKN